MRCNLIVKGRFNFQVM